VIEEDSDEESTDKKPEPEAKSGPSEPKKLIEEVSSKETPNKDWLNKKDSNYSQFNLNNAPKI
jgi:hypothetical protein